MKEFETRDQAPAGEYFVGDPCYAVPDELWDEVLDETGYLGLFKTEESMTSGSHEYDGCGAGGFVFRGHTILASRTAYGDGSYNGEDNVEYCVDSGTLGAVPIEMIDFSKYDREYMSKLGSFVTFKKPVSIEFHRDNQGKVIISDGYDWFSESTVIEIPTDPWEECDVCGETMEEGYCDERWHDAEDEELEDEEG